MLLLAVLLCYASRLLPACSCRIIRWYLVISAANVLFVLAQFVWVGGTALILFFGIKCTLGLRVNNTIEEVREGGLHRPIRPIDRSIKDRPVPSLLTYSSCVVLVHHTHPCVCPKVSYRSIACYRSIVSLVCCNFVSCHFCRQLMCSCIRGLLVFLVSLVLFLSVC